MKKIDELLIENNGKMIRGLIYGPKQNQRTSHIAILSHGFGANMIYMERYAKTFTELGFITIVFDFCGSGTGISDGDSRDMSVLTECEDLECVIKSVQKNPQFENSEIYLVGSSQGGFVSSMVASKLQDQIKALILYYPAFCIPDDAKKGNILGTLIDPVHIPASFNAIGVTLSSKYVLDAQNIDEKKQVYSYTGPVLLAHGKRDTIVDIQYAQRARSLFQNCQLIEIEDGDHGFGAGGYLEAMVATRKFIKS